MMSNIVIKIESLTKIYRLYNDPIDRLKESLHPLRKKYHHDFYAIRDIDISILKGETVGVIGKNGSGKSTLLKIITGVLTPTRGNVSVNGKVSALLELGTGFNPELTGLENIFFNGVLMGYTREQMELRVDNILSFADIGEFVHQPVKTYSSGMFVRLAFAVATAIDPDVLIVDEALAVGDMHFQAKCKKRMQSLMENGCTTIFVSHDISTVKSLCSRVLYLEDGVIKAEGSSGVVCEQFVYDQMGESGFFKSKDKEQKKNPDERDKYIQITLNDDKLRLFAKRTEFFRKGEGSIKILFADLFDESGKEVSEAYYGQVLEIQVIFHVLKSINSPVLATYISDKNMMYIIGTNNVYENVDIGPVQNGSTFCASFRFKNILCGGNYGITLILADSMDTSTYHDWIDNAILFKSIDLPDRPRWALANPGMDFICQPYSFAK
jgi:ABC-type polysaccharide/polyol phosphate transport system ATPase subunit